MVPNTARALGLAILAIAILTAIHSTAYGQDSAAAAPQSVLLLGGRGNLGSGSLTSGDFFDESAQTFSVVQGLAPQRVGYSATLLNDGKILVVGGLDPQCPSKKTLLFDRNGSNVKAGPDTICGHGIHTATVLKDGRVLIAGGSISDDLSSDCGELYDPAANRFQTTAGKLNVSRLRDAAIMLPDGSVLIAGGAHSSGGLDHALNSAELFDPTSGHFTFTKGRMHAKRDDLSAVLLDNGTVLIAGGYDDQTNVSHSAEVFNPATSSFKLLKGRIPISVYHLVRLKDGKVLMAGEDHRVVIFDPARATFTVAPGKMAETRTVYSATLLDDGRVLFAGGRGDNPDRVLHDAEIFDPARGSFAPCKNKLSAPRMEQHAVSLQ